VISPLLVLLATDVAAPHLAATRTQAPPIIDGNLDDAAWKAAVPSSAFTQQTPFDGVGPSEHTTMRVLYDDQAIYFGFDCQQLHSPIMGRLTRRDHDSESDWVWIQIDSRRDGKSAVMFAVNVVGVIADGTIRDQTVASFDWDENWEARTARRADGWSVEIRIPLRILRFDSGLPVQSWGMQAARYIADRQETDLWAYTSRDVAGGVARFGSLDDLRELKRGGHFELRPFALGRLRRRDAANDTVAHGYDESGAGGLDLKWHVTQDLTLDAAVMPDFAQVEADQLILNLTNVETFLPEKRALFLEGAEAFATPLQVFYSRRIGNAPTNPALRSDMTGMNTETLVEVPETALIYGAAKLVGNLNSHWTVGAMSAFTAPNQVAVQDKMTKVESTRTAQPAMSFNVLRLKRELGRNAYLGIIGTGATVIDEQTSGYPPVGANSLCPSGAQVMPGSRCFHDAYLGGIDGFWRSESGNYMVAGQAVESLIENGPPPDQSPALLDGTKINSGDHAPGGWLRIAKEGGKPFIWATEYTYAGKKLDYNDLGFQLRQNLHEFKASLGYRTFDAGNYTIDTTTLLELDVRRNLAGLDLGDTLELNTRWHLRRFWTVFLAADASRSHYDDREVGDGTALERAEWLGAKFEVFSDPRRKVAGSLSNQTQFMRGGVNTLLQGSLLLHLIPPLEIEILPQLTYTRGEPRFAANATVDVPSGDIFGDLTAKSAGGTLRASYAFTPTLTLQTYAQLFLASGHYDNLKQVTPVNNQVSLARIGMANSLTSTLTNPADFEQAALNVNVVLRWEYHLGSTLFLVYSRSQIPNVDLTTNDATLRPSAVLRGSAVDVFLIKLSYWWAS
jgi:hypothetical protein